VDNDVLLKALSYGLEEHFWPDADHEQIGVLGAARFVLADRLRKAELQRSTWSAALEGLLDGAETLEPDEAEVDLATAVEQRASKLGFELDSGESQLAAMVVTREIDRLETGDKRAIAGFEPMLSEIVELASLGGRVRCLEQIAHRVAADSERFASVADAVCRETNVDRALSTCFSCYSGIDVDQESVLGALLSYIEDVRKAAPTLLEKGP
jgi:hypothetical protein